MVDLHSDDAGLGSGVDAFGTNYPFILPGAAERGVLADFWLAYDGPDYVLPLRITELRHFGRPLGLEPEVSGENLCDVEVRDAAGTLVCDTATAAYVGRAFGTRFYVHEWRLNDVIVRAVQHAKFTDAILDALRLVESSEAESERLTEEDDYRLLEQPINPLASLIQPDDGRLDPRTYLRMPERVLSIEIDGVVLSGDIVLQAGYNIELAERSQATLPLPTALPTQLLTDSSPVALEAGTVISAITGAGVGALMDCTGAEVGLQSINDVRPDPAGAFRLSGVSCLYVKQPPTNPLVPAVLRPSTLQMGNHCSGCCSCDKYVAMYAEIAGVFDRLRADGTWLSALRDAYHELLDTFENVSHQALSLSVLGGVSQISTGEDGWVALVTIVGSVRNTTDSCWYDATLQFDLTSGFSDMPAIPPGSVTQKNPDGTQTMAQIGGGWPTYTSSWATIPAGSTASVIFTLAWSGPIEDLAPITAVTACCALLVAGAPFPAAAPAVTCVAAEVRRE